MAISLPGERSLAAATPSPFAAITRWIALTKAARTRRIALMALLDLDQSRLAGLGITRADVTAALSVRKQAGSASLLNAARARNTRL